MTIESQIPTQMSSTDTLQHATISEVNNSTDHIDHSSQTKVSHCIENDTLCEDDAAKKHGQKEDDRLIAMGYKPELTRSMSSLSMLGLAFSVLSSWGELGSSLTSGLSAGGPAVLVYGWLGVSLCSLAVVMSLAEICSAYPVNAGQYYWVAILAPPKVARGLSYITAWAQLAGLVGVGAAAVVNVAESTFGMITLVTPAFEDRMKPYMTVLECWAVIIACGAFNIYGRKLLNSLGLLALAWGIGGLCLTVIVLLTTTDSFQPARFVFTGYSNTTGLSDTFGGVVVCLGLTNLSYVYTAYESPAHLVEEMNNAQEDAPKAMVYSVYLGFLSGLVYLLTILFCISDLNAVLESDTPIFPIYFQATGSYAASCVLCGVLLLTQVFAELSFVAETSRSVMAFARDGGLPWSDLCSQVHPTLHVPVNAILLTCLAQACVMAIYFFSTTAFLTILALGTVGLYLSYALAIGVKLWTRGVPSLHTSSAPPSGTIALEPLSHGTPTEASTTTKGGGLTTSGPYRLSPTTGLLLNVVSLTFLTFEIIWFFVPTRYPVTKGNMNYLCVAACVVWALGYASWCVQGRRGYTLDGNVAKKGLVQGPRATPNTHFILA